MILWDVDDIAERVAELGNEIDLWYESQQVAEIVAVVVMNGAFMFAADLLRAIGTRIERTVFLKLGSYKGKHRASAPYLATLGDIGVLGGKHVLVIEDIVDTGHTAHVLYEALESQKPESVKMVTMLDKVTKRDPARPFTPAFVGFTCPDNFVMGYGLDVDGASRDLPWICDENG
jgi:hypoxanthine phosphoribosyltransferase